MKNLKNWLMALRHPPTFRASKSVINESVGLAPNQAQGPQNSQRYGGNEMKNFTINLSVGRELNLLSLAKQPLFTALSCALLIGFVPVSVSAVAPANPCAIGTFSGLSIPPSDPDAGSVQSITVISATTVTSATLGTYCDVIWRTVTSAGTPLPSGNNVSTIENQIKLPANWNGNYLQYGGGGFDGNLTTNPNIPGFGFISTSNLSPLSATYSPQGGYTIAATDSGHVPGTSGADFLNPDGSQNVEKFANYSYRSRHLLAVVAKSMIQSYYNVAPTRSYHGGSSNGGRAGIIEAARYPNDFDAIIAAYPLVYDLSATAAGFIRNSQAQFPGGAGCSATNLPACLNSQVIPTVPNSQLTLIAGATLSKCDAKDGLVDSILADPRTCDFNPDVDLPLCPTNAPNCLTQQQKNVLKTAYTDTAFPEVGLLSPRYLPGYESDPNILWAPVILGSTTPPTARPSQYLFGEELARFIVYNNPALSIQNFDLNAHIGDFARDWTACPGACSSLSQSTYFNSATDTNLSAFKAKGGKLLIFHGLSDTLITPLGTIDYYQQVTQKLGGMENTRQSVRLFLVPGRSHSTTNAGAAGAPANVGRVNGVNTGWLKALEDWDKTGVAPDTLAGVDSTLTVTRPICAYPFKAVYIGTATTPNDPSYNMASNFECRFYDFDGFRGKVDGLPELNKVKAGKTLKVQFSLGRNWGPNIYAVGFPQSKVIPCDDDIPEHDSDKADDNDNQGHDRHGNRDHDFTYVYKFVTDPSWAGTCRQLVIRLNEGTTLKANFKFRSPRDRGDDD